MRPDPAGAAPPRRKRRRSMVLAVSLLVLVLLLIVAFFVAEEYARAAARDYVRERVVEVLGLPSGEPVDVSLGEGSLILQALTGRVDEVQVDVDTVEVGPLAGSASIVATGVPLDSSQPVEGLDVQFTLPEARLDGLREYLSGANIESVELDENLVRIRSQLELFALRAPVSVGLEPTVDAGRVSFEPVDIELNEARISVAELREGIFGGLAGLLLQSQSICVAEFLPADFDLTDISVLENEIVLSIDGSGASLGDEQPLGSCE